ncbi:hypothetical protein HDU96_003638 [Phlyctochytrium bullatum]|nr:hypothetical protein HDU96_003638 [Phlyctochytrium bullatum]
MEGHPVAVSREQFQARFNKKRNIQSGQILYRVCSGWTVEAPAVEIVETITTTTTETTADEAEVVVHRDEEKDVAAPESTAAFEATAATTNQIRLNTKTTPLAALACHGQGGTGRLVLPAAMLVVSVCFSPRSPRWLAEKDRHEEGQAVIAKLRMRAVKDPEVVAEYDGIRHGVEFKRRIGSASWSELTKPGIGRRVVIAVINQTFQQLTGINVILYCSNDIFKNMGFSDADSDYSSIVTFPVVNALINFLATFPGMWAVERFGRKPLLVYGGFTMALAHALVFGFITGSNNGTQSLSWGAVFSIFLSLTWGPVVWSYQAEIFPLRVRAKGTGIATMTNWTWNAIIAYAFPVVFKALNKEPMVYWIFASTSLAMGFWALFGVPETKGKTLEDIDEIFGQARSADDALEVGQKGEK